MNVIERDNSRAFFGEIRMNIVSLVSDMAVTDPQHWFASFATTQCVEQCRSVDSIATVTYWDLIDDLAAIGEHPQVGFAL
jgi:hypothetical protein